MQIFKCTKNPSKSPFYAIVFLVAISFFLLSPSYADSIKPVLAEKDNKQKIKSSSKILYSINFEKESTLNARTFLTSNGFEFESDAKDQSDLALSFSDKSLVLDATDQLFGLIIDMGLHLKDAKKIRITWGVTKYPEGASYAKGVRNEAVMIYVYYGNKKLPSDSWFIPNAPYYIGLFLGETEPVNKIFTGIHFTQGGRYVCLANPKIGETITSEFNLDKGFKNCFGKDKKVPFVSGIAIEVETSNTTPSKAYIKKIEIL